MAIRFKGSTRRLGYYMSGLILFYYFLIREQRVVEKFETIIEDADAKTVWEYWADFSNYQKINPTINKFEIEDERGTYDNWEYRVNYWETLTRLPLNVFIRARYIVTPEQTKGHFKEPFRILSEHDTCLWGFFCSHTDADMTFIPAPSSINSGTKKSSVSKTKVTETVHFGAPILLQWYYINEFRTQRDHIAQQLKNIDFSNI